MKYLPCIAGGLLGAMFIAFSIMFFAGVKPPEGGPVPPKEAIDFGTAMATTGYMHMVKVFELLGGILVAIPKTRNYGLLILGPIIINVLAYHQFLQKDGIFQGMLIGICALALYLLWAGRRNFAGLKN
ncbi:DoxX family protein [Luteolibacter sp. Populi]|uniref:DoxX family protein n=1 Tax=Luteolibacter sp. Populi TaxID=3230487 RepID=UPI0034678DE8